MEINEFAKIALHRKRLKAATKDLDINQLEKLANDITEIVAEREQEIADALAEKEAHQAKIDEMRNLLLEQGLTVDDLIDTQNHHSDKKATSRIVEPKYRIVDENGVEHLWTGRGRAPKPFQKQLDQGHAKASFLI
ncbi:DNA-binding protein [Thiosulfatimonas sediminis]|uniref:DNA-binding protein n=1 Tax=Thiosulfatimonas sediminis TaxID=2675054 RepID=A0A6F8PV94_9GAMM|nr:H-NS histone family protein [Thiosulfatimonas sediminis]BBP46051.1 DNA-binding protein [Thiosulfatimonas sediminis]